MKKVLVFGMTDNPGGVESVIMNYYRNIDRRKIQFDFLCNSEIVAYEDEIIELGGNVYKITPRKESYFKFRRELNSFMAENAVKYSAIWVNLCSLVNIDYLIFAKKYGISKRIIHCHNADNDAGFIKEYIHKFNRFRLKKYATDFWSCSESASPWFFTKDIVSSAHYKVITNAIDIRKYRKNHELRDKYRRQFGLEDKIVIGHVGRFHFQKNHKFLVNVFEELSKKDPRYHLLLVGQGTMEQEIRKMVKVKGLTEKVTFAGVRSDVENMYQIMDLFVLPSIFEGLGVVALEAQACSLPCLLADTVPMIVKVNPNVAFLSLDAPINQWVDTIVRMVGSFIRDEDNKIENSEYNIFAQIENFEMVIGAEE
ncbi:MAG: glycosyltransferase family 1 protein [Lachnospiraceae bacterium]|nr:glycosyltransferase family 1 protein [Lachnospiraceae bacterium]